MLRLRSLRLISDLHCTLNTLGNFQACTTMSSSEDSEDEYDPSQDLADPTGTQEELPHRDQAQASKDAVTA